MHTIKSLSLFFLFLTFSICSKAQAEDSLQHQLARKWNHAKTYTLKVAALMPEEAYNFKPVPDEMSFGEQLLHIAQNMNWLCGTYLFGRGQDTKREATLLGKQAIITILGAAYDSALAVHYRLTEKQLEEVVPFFAGPMTRRQVLILLHDHQTHHVGQLIVYLRLKGIKPPEYIGW